MRLNNDLVIYANEMKDMCVKYDTIPEEYFKKFGVNRGLRDLNGKGVLTGLTNISKIVSFKNVDVDLPIVGDAKNILSDLVASSFNFVTTFFFSGMIT